MSSGWKGFYTWHGVPRNGRERFCKGGYHFVSAPTPVQQCCSWLLLVFSFSLRSNPYTQINEALCKLQSDRTSSWANPPRLFVDNPQPALMPGPVKIWQCCQSTLDSTLPSYRLSSLAQKQCTVYVQLIMQCTGLHVSLPTPHLQLQLCLCC